MSVSSGGREGDYSDLSHRWFGMGRDIRQSAGAGVRAIPGDASGQCPDRLGVRNTVPAEVDPGCHSLDAGTDSELICGWCGNARGGALLCRSCGRETVALDVYGKPCPVTGVRSWW